MRLTFFAHILTWPYRLGLWLRHKGYDLGVLRSASCNIPVISIGNIGVGGTGKTPHTELILRLFSHDMTIAVLSRGYKRSSKGFHYVGLNSLVAEVGDEPLQIKRKFPDVVVAVCVNRIEGIDRIQKNHPHIQCIVLDDAFQYRRLAPACSILLSDYHRPYTKDLLLPFGRLRDLPSQASRADVVIVSKAPSQPSSTERENQYKLLNPNRNQKLLFSCYTYSAPCQVFSEAVCTWAGVSGADIIALTGIAQPKLFLDHCGKSGEVVLHLAFGDHHYFTQKDVCKMNEAAAQYPNAAIYTTEKDAMRLLEATGLSEQVKAALYYIPMQVEFCTEKERCHFVEIVKNYL